jgi:tetratricopeptide (TPR) repeat protein
MWRTYLIALIIVQLLTPRQLLAQASGLAQGDEALPLALQAWNTQQLDMARTYFLQALDIARATGASQHERFILLHLALVAMVQGDEAGEFDALSELAEVNERLGRYEAAIETYDLILRVQQSPRNLYDPRLALLRQRKATAHQAAGQGRESAEELERAAEILAAIALQEGSEDTSAVLYQQAYEQYKESGDAIAAAGVLGRTVWPMLSSGRYTEALEIYKKQLKL